ncbi:MAG: sigma-70 family RNA polymerase sigma factor [Anaerolineaceae bacterium]|nr:sigma-70 family RNA polymerase sigma factor [Anaerolineaceae bacterium]MBN2678488.1 sigma-70 family RNA polymerase sigma factor [Anaerolineaceae bacterium]
MKANPESEWLDLAIKGDDDAFAHLVQTYQTPVYNLCYRMLGNAGDAEDAAQESFWRAWQYLKRYDRQRSFITWLLSITAHFCIDQLRKRRLELVPLDVLPEEDAPDPGLSPEAISRLRDEQKQMRKLLGRLGPQDRAAIIMRYWYDFSEVEIAASLSLTVSAVKSRLHRARRELALGYDECYEVPALAERRRYESPAF